jgi:hypothetical protein
VKASEPDRQAHSFRDLALSGQPSTDYAPQPIVSIPIYLRNKSQYYKDAVDAVRKQLDILWEAYSQRPGADRDEFERSERAKWFWDHGTPPWWGVNDVIGYIQVLIDPLDHELYVSLFLPTKRISRVTKNKVFWNVRTERRDIDRPMGNAGLRLLILDLIADVANDTRVRRYHLDLRP